MLMFNESGIVRHTDIDETWLKSHGKEMVVNRMQKNCAAGFDFRRYAGRIVPLGPTLSRRSIRASVSTSAIKIRTE
jgi:hypothetical protein